MFFENFTLRIWQPFLIFFSFKFVKIFFFYTQKCPFSGVVWKRKIEKSRKAEEDWKWKNLRILDNKFTTFPSNSKIEDQIMRSRSPTFCKKTSWNSKTRLKCKTRLNTYPFFHFIYESFQWNKYDRDSFLLLSCILDMFL